MPFSANWPCTSARDVVPIAGRPGKPARKAPMANGRCRMHGGKLKGGPRGNRNAFKDGRYTAEAIAGRRQVAALIRAMRAMACATEEAS